MSEIIDGAYRVGIVGLGRMGVWSDDAVHSFTSYLPPYPFSHSSTYSSLRETKIVAGSDISLPSRRAFAARWRVPQTYEHYQEMFEKESLDIVSVTTHAPLHARIVGDAIAAGIKGIWVEKPLGCSLAEVDHLVRLATDAGTAVVYGAQRRYDDVYSKALEPDDSWGKRLRAYTVTFTGGLMHSHSHSVDTLLYLLGDPTPISVQATLSNVQFKEENGRRYLDGDPAVYTLSVECDNGTRFDLLPIGEGTKRCDYHLLFQQATINIYNNGRSTEIMEETEQESTRSLGQVLSRKAESRDSYLATAQTNLLKDLLSCMQSGKRTCGNVFTARSGMEVLLGAVESHLQGGKRIMLPLDDRDLYVPSR